jgi:hypothetical protein
LQAEGDSKWSPISWKEFCSSIYRELGVQTNASPTTEQQVYGPLLECLADFAENAGLALSPDLPHSRALWDDGLPGALRDVGAFTAGQKSLVNALQTQHRKIEFKPGDMTIQTSWYAGWKLDLDGLFSATGWPFWIAHKLPDEEAVNWIHFHPPAEASQKWQLWLWRLGHEIASYWRPRMQESGVIVCNPWQAQEAIAQIAACAEEMNLAMPYLTDLEKVCDWLGQQSSCTGETALNRDQWEARVGILKGLATMMGELSKGFQSSGFRFPQLTQVEQFATAWRSIMRLHQIFATLTDGLFDGHSLETAASPKPNAEYRFDADSWILEQRRENSNVYVELKTQSVPRGKEKKPSLQVVIEHREPLSAQGESLDLLDQSEHTFGSIVNQMRGVLERIKAVDALSRRTKILDGSKVVLSVSRKGAGDSATIDESVQALGNDDWLTFTRDCRQALIDLFGDKILLADAIGVKWGKSSSVAFEPSLHIGLPGSDPSVLKEAAEQIFRIGEQEWIRATILDPKPGETYDGFQEQREWDFPLEDYNELQRQFQNLDGSGLVEGDGLGAWCDGLFVVNQYQLGERLTPSDDYVEWLSTALGSSATKPLDRQVNRLSHKC